MEYRFAVAAWAAAFAGSSIAALAQTPPAPTPPNQVDQVSYFRADVRDRPGCSPSYVDGAMTWPQDIGNPAIDCPDASGWTSFLTAIDQEFWTWATDQTIWPAAPKALCAAGTTGPACCDAALMNAPVPVGATPDIACPYYPPDWTSPPALTTARPNSSHSHDFLNRLDPARVLRQEEAEIVFRNKSFVRYTFEQNLYNKEGLGARFTAMNDWIAAYAPYNNPALAIDYPTDAVMFKVDFLSQSQMLEYGLITATGPGGEAVDPPNNPLAPYVTMQIEETLAPGDEQPELYYLVAVTAASKALPNWHWYAIEHVGNLGRCDFTGCNDSYGYDAAGVTVGDVTVGQNFIPPKTENSEDASSDIVFDLGTPYTSAETGEAITPELTALLSQMGIATATTPADPDMPAPSSPAWLSYRLKASQTEYVTAIGIPTHAGQSITEGGFVDSASCITCHAQAGPNAFGNPGVPGIGAKSELNMFGLNQTVNGAPDPSWFFADGTNQMQSLQMDFVWGMLGANCIVPDGTTGNCASYTTGVSARQETGADIVPAARTSVPPAALAPPAQ